MSWFDSPYTGIFTHFGSPPRRAHDPDIYVRSGILAPWGARHSTRGADGAGWDDLNALNAALGEGVERLQCAPLSCDDFIDSCYHSWTLDEPAIAPRQWVLFSAEQYAQENFPFQPFTDNSTCRWVCSRNARNGEPVWVPEEFVYLDLPPERTHRIAPAYSTGLASGRRGDPILLRGLQEVIERDAVMGAWWGTYRLEENDPSFVLGMLDASIASRILRPNLRYRFFRVATPFSSHVTLVSIAGEDHEGFCFSVGSACRENREQSWLKSISEAIHSRFYARYLRTQRQQVAEVESRAPTSFAAHALFYSLHPEQLSRTVFARTNSDASDTGNADEPFEALVEKLGAARPVLFRLMTPPDIFPLEENWHVVRVLVPDLTPMHGAHALPHLGSPLWNSRPLNDWQNIPPHPFA